MNDDDKAGERRLVGLADHDGHDVLEPLQGRAGRVSP